MRFLIAIRRSLAPLGLAFVAMLGCYKSGEGADPDESHPYFPTGIALSPSGKWLFLANSNFDLAFNAGTLQAYDVGKIRTAFDACHAAVSKASPNAQALCEPDAAQFVSASVRIGAFAADMRAIPRYKDGNAVPNAGRLLLPVRGNASLTAIDWDENGDQITLRCTTGAKPNDKSGVRCAPEWLLGTDPAKSERGLVLEGEPFGVAIPEHWPNEADQEPRNSGGIAAVVHQSTGNVSLFVRVASDGPTPQGKLAYVLGGLAGGGTGIAPLDIVQDGEKFIPRFLVTNRSQPNVLVVQYFPDPKVERSGLVLSDVVPILPQASGYDTRGVVVDPPGTGEKRPIRVFLTNRTPAALVVGEVDPDTHKLTFHENFALPIGPSRLTRASIEVSPGVFRTRIIAASFDARSIVIFDPDTRRISNVIRTHRGPYGMVVDAANKLAYISNFTDSTIQVLELDPANPAQRIWFSVGRPSGPTS